MNQRETALAATTGAILASVLGYTLIVKPTYERWENAHSRVDQLASDLEKANALVKRKTELTDERDKIETTIAPTDQFGNPLKGPDAVAVFLDHLDSLQAASQLSQYVSNIQYVHTEIFDAYAELQFEMRARAPLKLIQDFLVRMRTGPSYLRAQAVRIQPRDDGTVEADISLVGLTTWDALDSDKRPKKKP